MGVMLHEAVVGGVSLLYHILKPVGGKVLILLSSRLLHGLVVQCTPQGDTSHHLTPGGGGGGKTTPINMHH